jgi:hypothetical protein
MQYLLRPSLSFSLRPRQIYRLFCSVDRLPWEPHPDVFLGLGRARSGERFTLKTLIKEDASEARLLFNKVLQRSYPHEMAMWNKWAVMVYLHSLPLPHLTVLSLGMERREGRDCPQDLRESLQGGIRLGPLDRAYPSHPTHP